MSGEGALDKRKINLRVAIETCEKVLKKYSQKEDDDESVSFVRALEDATRDIELPPEAYAEIANEVEANRKKRMERRAQRRASK